jgi:putative ABC transport system ATP-binding protein
MFHLQGIAHRYLPDTPPIQLDDWQAEAGSQWWLAGPSGSGKTTLLLILAGLLTPSTGRVHLDGQDWARLRPAARDAWRARRIGFVPQNLHLIDALSVRDNLRLAGHFSGLRRDAAHLAHLAEQLGLQDLLDRKPNQLSQGQAQRAAILRAVQHRPALLLADEPTAALDDAHSARVIDLLTETARNAGATLVVSSHDQRLARSFTRVMSLS